MGWYLIHLIAHLLWDSPRFSRLAPNDKAFELLLLRQQLLFLRRHQSRGPVISRGEKFLLLTLIEQMLRRADLHKTPLDQMLLIFKPETLLRWHRELVRHKWTFANAPKLPGRPSIDPQFVQLIL